MSLQEEVLRLADFYEKDYVVDEKITDDDTIQQFYKDYQSATN